MPSEFDNATNPKRKDKAFCMCVVGADHVHGVFSSVAFIAGLVGHIIPDS